jgi:hypothetical protein
MNWKKIDLNFLLLLVLFIASYFYYDYISLNKVIAIIFIGIFLALGSYVLYGLSFRLWSKLILLAFIAFIFYALPNFFTGETSRVPVDSRFLGSWATDNTDGYSIRLKVVKDSAYLSQSNLSESKAYKLSTINDTVILNNESLGREYRWNFSFVNQERVLLLYSSKDSLIFTKAR